MATRVLVFPCGSEIGLEIARSLGRSIHVELVGASSVSSNHGKYVFERYVEGLPFIDAPDFVERLNEVIEDHDVEYVFPSLDNVLVRLLAAGDELRAVTVTSPAETADICFSKRRTYETLAGRVRVPQVYDASDPDLPFPVFVKPDSGYGSRGAHVVPDADALRTACAADPTAIVLEYLPGDEYTIDCFTDRHGELRFAGGRQRVRTMNGISVDTLPVDDPAFRSIAEAINGVLDLRGVWFYQLRRAADGEPALLEVACRVAGAMGLHRNLGVNLPLLALFDRMGRDVEVRRNPGSLRMDRALAARFSSDVTYRHVYLDLDDTLIQRGKLDPLALAFVAQCRNRGVGVHLLSRHATDLAETLAARGLTGLFDSTVHITDGAPKSGFITERDAIFVDDSFAERREVRDALGIPTYAPDMVESLMDWRL